MPELPDIVVLARSMDQGLRGKQIEGVAVHQPKCLNVSLEELSRTIRGATIGGARQRGKWGLIDLVGGDVLALNLGMGGMVGLHGPGEEPDPKRERVVLRFTEGDHLWIRFWWFGHVHLLPGGDLSGHPRLSSLGPEPLADDFTAERLAELLQGRRGAIKRYLLDQKFIAGIGNVYVQDILWHARLHPLTPAKDLSNEGVIKLYGAIRHVLEEGIRWGGGPREYDIWGTEGRYTEHLQVGYRTGKPCPACRTPVEELRVSNTTSYICPRCQPPPR